MRSENLLAGEDAVVDRPHGLRFAGIVPPIAGTGIVAAGGDTLSMLVGPRFTDTIWFYGLLCALLLLVSSLAWRARVMASVRRQRELEIEVERRTAELARLSRLTEAINEAVTIEEVLDHLYENLNEVLPYDRIGLALLDEDRIVLRAVWARGRAEATGIDRGYEAPLSNSHSLMETLQSGRPRLISNLEEYFAEHPDSESTRRILEEGIRSSLTCPLKALGQPVGFIFFSSFETGTYDESHADFLQKIAGHLSMIVSKSRLYDDLVETKARLEQANRDLEHLAAIDPLTGLANRRAFDERLQSEWRRAQRAQDPITILMIDVDHFKPFNDLYGHMIGDQCLQSIARALSDTVRRAGDLVARYGGEEFAVILPQCEINQGEVVAETLRDTVERLGVAHQSLNELCVTISVGIATAVPDSSNTPEMLLDRADRALYDAKRHGRNRIARYEEITIGN